MLFSLENRNELCPSSNEGINLNLLTFFLVSQLSLYEEYMSRTVYSLN